MIATSGSTASAGTRLRSIQSQMTRTIDMSVEETLDDLIRLLQPVTPVVTGAMQADYTIGHAGSIWELLDTASSPQGYDYPGRVVNDPTWSQAYGSLNRALDSGERMLGANLDLAITRMVDGTY